MMNLHRSSSSAESAFDRLHPTVQRWVYDQRWHSLRSIQSMAIPPILAGDRDVIISAGTAGGKTEAAWLPILSALAFDEDAGESRLGVKALMVSPLKALINDQAERLTTICEPLDLPVVRRHGDVSGRERNALTSNPDGILLITPESLEALFVLQGPRIPALFAGLRYIVVDELHAFIGTERGAQLQSLLHRIDLATGRTAPRVALSATLADTDVAAAFLTPDRASGVQVLRDPDGGGGELRLQIRGYVNSGSADGEIPATTTAITTHLFGVLRGTKNLVFANSRRNVEAYTDALAGKSDELRVPNEFYPHHGSLSRELREDVERKLKTSEMGATAICTSTLEMGIDIGSVTSIAQIGSPGNVSSLRQRLGRSGRRGNPAILRVYVTEQAIDERSHPADQIHQELIESISITELMLEHWLEPPDTGNIHLSTLVQQTLSVIAQDGGAHAQHLFDTLCGTGPFHTVTPQLYGDFLRSLASHDLIIQASDGLLLPGETGERLLNHYSFYAAFESAEEYRLVAEGHTLGSLPISTPIIPGTYMIFSGRRWEILSVDAEQKVIELRRASGGRVPDFGGNGITIADGIRRRMQLVLESQDVPRYLDSTAQALLAEARSNYRRLQLDASSLIENGEDTLIFPWRGDKILSTTTALLTEGGFKSGQEGAVLQIEKTNPTAVREYFSSVLSGPVPDPVTLAELVPDKVREKHDRFLSDALLCHVTSGRDFDIAGALNALREIIR